MVNYHKDVKKYSITFTNQTFYFFDRSSLRSSSDIHINVATTDIH